jgi:biotin synthase-like enzyme
MQKWIFAKTISEAHNKPNNCPMRVCAGGILGLEEAWEGAMGKASR